MFKCPWVKFLVPKEKQTSKQKHWNVYLITKRHFNCCYSRTYSEHRGKSTEESLQKGIRTRTLSSHTLIRLRKEFQGLLLWQIRSLLRTPEALTVYTAFFHTLDHCQLPKETARDSTLIGMQCDCPHPNPRQSYELSPGEEDSYLLLYHIFKNF